MKFIEKIKNYNLISGKDAPVTKFLIKDLTIWERKVLGANKNTVKLVGDNELTAIKFNVDESYLENVEYSKVDILGTLDINRFFNFKKREWEESKQILIEGVRIK
jgi:single-stranded-DNA-specific exonuclease